MLPRAPVTALLPGWPLHIAPPARPLRAIMELPLIQPLVLAPVATTGAVSRVTSAPSLRKAAAPATVHTRSLCVENEG